MVMPPENVTTTPSSNGTKLGQDVYIINFDESIDIGEIQLLNNANPAVKINPATEDTLETLAKESGGNLAAILTALGTTLKTQEQSPISGFAKESGGNLDKLVAPILTVNSVKTVLNAIAKTDGTQFDPTTLAKDSTLTNKSQFTQLTDGTNILSFLNVGTTGSPEWALPTSGITMPLAADITAATADTTVQTVTQAGILKGSIFNPSGQPGYTAGITMYVWFGAAPGAGTQIVLLPGMSKDVTFETAVGNMQYKSSAAGGQLIYELDG
jgi:hypothetical protein